MAIRRGPAASTAPGTASLSTPLWEGGAGQAPAQSTAQGQEGGEQVGSTEGVRGKGAGQGQQGQGAEPGARE